MVSVIGVELPEITLHLLYFAIDDLWMFRVCLVLFLIDVYYCFWLFVLNNFVFRKLVKSVHWSSELN